MLWAGVCDMADAEAAALDANDRPDEDGDGTRPRHYMRPIDHRPHPDTVSIRTFTR